MITKNDLVLLLTDLDKNGIECKDKIKKTLTDNNIDIEIIKFINSNRELDVTKFYEKLRKSYNNKKSKLYLNIVKEVEDPIEVLTTLSALQTLILLYSKLLDNKLMFLRHVRAEEISLVLMNYFKTFDITNCLKLLKLIKSDLKCLEYASGRIS